MSRSGVGRTTTTTAAGNESTGMEDCEIRRYKGVRRRRWGKWVSEIRVPGSPERLWLGSYSTPEAAAVAYDIAVFYLKGPSSLCTLNFPNRVSPVAWTGLSPRSIQKVASDSGMAVDAELVVRRRPSVNAGNSSNDLGSTIWEGDGDYQMYGGNGASGGEVIMDISVDDMEIYL